jgi:hypothetical protein
MTIMTPKPFNTVFKEAWEIYTGRFHLFLPLVVLFILPAELVVSYLLPAEDATFDWMNVVRFAMSMVLAIFLGGLVEAFVSISTNAAQEGTPITFGDSLKKGKKYIGRVLLMLVIGTVSLVLLFLLFIIPGIIFMNYWSFSIQGIVLSKKTAWESLNYSKALVKGQWWEVFGRFFTLFVPIYILSWVLYSLIPLAYELPWLDAMLTTIIDILIIFTSVFATVYYKDLLRVKQAKEEKKQSA